MQGTTAGLIGYRAVAGDLDVGAVEWKLDQFALRFVDMRAWGGLGGEGSL